MKIMLPSAKMKISIRHCARCNKDHEMDFQHFKGQSFEDANGVVYDFWGLCPTTGDPVLLTNKNPNLVNPTPDSELPTRNE